MRLFVGRIEAQSFREIADGVVVFSLISSNEAGVDVSTGIVRSQPQRFLCALGGFRNLALGQESADKIRLGGAHIRRDSHRFRAVLHGEVDFAALE